MRDFRTASDKENPILKGEIENLRRALEEFLFIEKAQA